MKIDENNILSYVFRVSNNYINIFQGRKGSVATGNNRRIEYKVNFIITIVIIY